MSASETSRKFGGLHPTSDYEDHEIFGSRVRTTQLIDRIKAGNDSECVLIDIGTFASNEQWKLRDLIGIDRRLVDMSRGLKIEHAFPIQRYSWPKMHRSAFASLVISPRASGKTYAHVLYSVSRCILSTSTQATNEILEGHDGHQYEPNATTDLDNLIIHPKFIVICSSQDHVESINRIIDRMKEEAYGINATDSRRARMPPVSRTINIHQEDTKLALRCNESDILLGTPPAILRCLKKNFIHFSKCKKVFFDDLDLCLQLQNTNIRELIKIYLRQIDETADGVERSCRIHLFARKWTDLVRQFMSSVFTQRILLFGSLAEASVYNNIKFDVEFYEDLRNKCAIISALISVLADNPRREKIGIVCRSDEEAGTIGQVLIEMGHSIKMLRDDNSNGHSRVQARARAMRDLVFVISDVALEFEVEVSNRRKPLDDIMHIIHASLPDDMLIFDQRFRIAFRHIQDKRSGLTSTILVGPNFNVNLLKQLYDLMSRSSNTQTASKMMIRDLINLDKPVTQICWRWATTGLCRLEKLSRDDRFGSYCNARHSFDRSLSSTGNGKPESGLVKITITHIISPSEFYFWFESHRRHSDGKWVKLEECGVDHMWMLQKKLDKLRLTDTRSVPLNSICKGKVYGVYFPQETRVDRVRILDEPKHETGTTKINAELEYSKLIPVFKIDYGLRLEVYVKNLIELPGELLDCPAQCNRGFHLGYKPNDNEPNWLYKSKKFFYDSVTANGACEITAWIRMNRENCFWFENLTVSRRLTNIDSVQVCSSQPHRDLYQQGLAELITAEPQGLSTSNRLETMCRWNFDRLKDLAQYAFLRQDMTLPEIVLLNVLPNFEIVARQSCFTKQLDALEHQIAHDFDAGELKRQSYFAEDVYCIARVSIEGSQTFNRVRIEKIIELDNDIEAPECSQEAQVLVYCLDHGDRYTVEKSNLYQASSNYIKLLPFQALRCQLANINEELVKDRGLNLDSREKIIDLTRFSNNDYRPVKAQKDEDGNLYLFVQTDKPSVFEPLSSLMQKHGLDLHIRSRPEYETPIEIAVEENSRSRSDGMTESMNQYILDLLRDIVKEELKDVGVETC